jgi:DNA-binding NtrC family response regulator
MADLLRTTGEHAIALAETAEDGLRRLRDETYDVVVTDLELPDASGLQMLDQARAEGRLARAVVVACAADLRLRRQALSRGAIFALEPLDPEQMSAVTRQAACRQRSG